MENTHAYEFEPDARVYWALDYTYIHEASAVCSVQVGYYTEAGSFLQVVKSDYGARDPELARNFPRIAGTTGFVANEGTGINLVDETAYGGTGTGSCDYNVAGHSCSITTCSAACHANPQCGSFSFDIGINTPRCYFKQFDHSATGDAAVPSAVTGFRTYVRDESFWSFQTDGHVPRRHGPQAHGTGELCQWTAASASLWCLSAPTAPRRRHGHRRRRHPHRHAAATQPAVPHGLSATFTQDTDPFTSIATDLHVRSGHFQIGGQNRQWTVRNGQTYNFEAHDGMYLTKETTPTCPQATPTFAHYDHEQYIGSLDCQRQPRVATAMASRPISSPPSSTRTPRRRTSILAPCLTGATTATSTPIVTAPYDTSVATNTFALQTQSARSCSTTQASAAYRDPTELECQEYATTFTGSVSVPVQHPRVNVRVTDSVSFEASPPPDIKRTIRRPVRRRGGRRVHHLPGQRAVQ